MSEFRIAVVRPSDTSASREPDLGCRGFRGQRFPLKFTQRGRAKSVLEEAE